MKFWPTGEQRLPLEGEYYSPAGCDSLVLKVEKNPGNNIGRVNILLSEPTLPHKNYEIIGYRSVLCGEIFFAQYCNEVFLSIMPSNAKLWILKLNAKPPIGYEFTGEFRTTIKDECWLGQHGYPATYASNTSVLVLKRKEYSHLNIVKSDKTLTERCSSALVSHKIMTLNATAILNWSH